MTKKKPVREGYVKAQCVFCKAVKKVGAGEVPKGELPMCEKCFGPMVAIGAVVR